LIQSNQKSSQQRGFFAAQASALKSIRTTGCNIFAPLRSLNPLTSAKICYAPAITQAIMFCLISPEAYLPRPFKRPPLECRQM
jgi:hypothetical protein